MGPKPSGVTGNLYRESKQSKAIDPSRRIWAGGLPEVVETDVVVEEEQVEQTCRPDRRDRAVERRPGKPR